MDKVQIAAIDQIPGADPNGSLKDNARLWTGGHGPGGPGGKAANLIRLAKAGFSVPAFFLIRGEQRSADLKALDETFLREGMRYAVRSSGAMEDQEDSAMAGLFRTFLDVDVRAVEDRVLDCFASAQSEGVRHFARELGLKDPGTMTVIVQEMVTPELSGVLFTANPQGLVNEMMAVVGAGRGDAVVEDRIPVTTLIHHFHDGIDLIRGQNGSPDLSQAMVRSLRGLARQLKAVFPWPVDAEFAVAGGKFWLLQARPVTTLDLEHIHVLDNSNISESYPGLTLPLSADFARTVYSGIFRRLVARILGPASARRIGPVLDEMVASSSGRMYYQISNWYRVMKLLPLSKYYIRIWQEMMGVGSRQVSGAQLSLPLWDRITGVGGFLYALWRTPKEMTRLHDEFLSFRQAFEAALAKDPDRAGLIRLYEAMKRELLDRWDVTLLNDVRAFLFTALLRRQHAVAGRDPDRIIADLGDVESLRPIRLLTRIARVAPPAFLALAEAEAVTAYLSVDGPFQEILRDYLNEYGDRYLEELKLESKTFRTDPLLLVGAIRALRDPEGRHDRADAAPVSGQGSGGDRGERAPSSLTRRLAAGAIRSRELSRLDRTRIFGMAREIFRRLGRDLAAAGKIETAEDVFWLTQDEVFTAESDLRAAVLERKAMYQEFARLPMLSRLEFAGPVFDRILPGELDWDQTGDRPLVGTGASPGIVRGQVLILKDPHTAESLAGRILVTRQTDPGWVFLIARAAGLIAEKGSLLSHTAIIARELGKPCVVGVKGAMDLFADGEAVEIDGSTGQIRRIRHDGSH